MLSTINRFQLATRMHIALRVRFGVRINVGELLRHRRYAMQALDLCHESGDMALSELASRFEDSTAVESAKAHLAIAADLTRAELAQLATPLRPTGRRGRAWAPAALPWTAHQRLKTGRA